MSESSALTLAQRNYCDPYEISPSKIQKNKSFCNCSRCHRFYWDDYWIGFDPDFTSISWFFY